MNFISKTIAILTATFIFDVVSSIIDCSQLDTRSLKLPAKCFLNGNIYNIDQALGIGSHSAVYRAQMLSNNR